MPRVGSNSRTKWDTIGTVVGNTSTYEFTFILKSFRSRVGDLVAVKMETPNDSYSSRDEVMAWGRITAISRFNPFFPQEAAHELTEDAVPILDTVLSTSRDYLQADVLILGVTFCNEERMDQLFPLTYPIQPAAEVLHPPSSAVKKLLAGDQKGSTLHVGTLLSRSDVPVVLSADRVVARHLAILAMTGGGKTVAARRILAELIKLRYPILIFDPHGDYIGLWQASRKGASSLGDTDVRLFYPHIAMTPDNHDIVSTLIAKMTTGLTEAQQEALSELLDEVQIKAKGISVLDHIGSLLKRLEKKIQQESNGTKVRTMCVLRRSLTLVWDRFRRMEATNEQMRKGLKKLEFEKLPDPEGRPEGLIRPGQVSILYLSGYDHLTQSTIVSVVMEALFNHRSTLSNKIAPFMTVVEEAHNFIPSTREGTTETPSLPTLRRVITEGRKFGTGLLLITQRPSRVDETILAQCNSFLVLRLVNPRDQSYVRQVMENLSDADARLLPGFGPGQGLVSGQAVRFPLLVKIRMDEDLISTSIGDEDFLDQAWKWKPDRKAPTRVKAAELAATLEDGRRPRGRPRSRT